MHFRILLVVYATILISVQARGDYTDCFWLGRSPICRHHDCPDGTTEIHRMDKYSSSNYGPFGGHCAEGFLKNPMLQEQKCHEMKNPYPCKLECPKNFTEVAKEATLTWRFIWPQEDGTSFCCEAGFLTASQEKWKRAG